MHVSLTRYRSRRDVAPMIGVAVRLRSLGAEALI
jgi:hypothetical protein